MHGEPRFCGRGQEPIPDTAQSQSSGREAVAAAILAAVEGGILPPGMAPLERGSDSDVRATIRRARGSRCIGTGSTPVATPTARARLAAPGAGAVPIIGRELAVGVAGAGSEPA